MSDSNKLAVQDRWSDAEASNLADLDALVYQSRLIGSDPRLVVWGGGNTSLKVMETDYRGRSGRVLRVKGSGSDLKAVTPRDFPGVRLDDLLPLLEREQMSDEEMVAYLEYAVVEPRSPRPSIETLLHGFVAARSVLHTHADAILALTNTRRSADILREVFGESIAVVPYLRPGFALAKLVSQAANQPGCQGVVLLNHGLITWHDDPREAYRLHLELVNRAAEYIERASQAQTSAKPEPLTAPDAPKRQEIAAALAPVLRGLLGKTQRVVSHFDDSEDVLSFVSGQSLPLERVRAALAAGAATPDHILNIKRTALWVEPADLTDAQAVASATQTALAQYQQDYQQYFERYRQDEPMLAPLPRIVLVAGLGMFAVGKDSHATTVSSDIFHHTIAIIEGAERVDAYQSLTPKDAFEAEYWPLELYKLTLAPPEQKLSRRVALITGAAGEIGSAIARRFAAEGAHVVCADVDLAKARSLVDDLNTRAPNNRGLAVLMDVSSEASVAEAYQRVLLEYGGVDVVVVNAGVAYSSPLDKLSLDQWQRSFAINATGAFLVAREALKIMKAQQTGGSFVFVATKNVPAPGKDFGAYSASKAAQAQLGRVLALEGGAYGIRANLINPDAIFGASGLWSVSVREERARSYGIDSSQLEEYYRSRNILRAQVTADDVAEAALFYASDASAKTTGGMLPVDGGLREAFPR